MGEEAVTVAAVVLAAVLVGLAVRRWVVFVTQVDSVSMVPALLPGRRLWTRRLWRPERIRRGEILVVASQELGRTVVKRVLGLPGERVVIEPGGGIHVDGRPVAEPYVVHPGGACGVFRVPPGHVMLLGDNRARSSDSRTWRNPYLPVRAVRGTIPVLSTIVVPPWPRKSASFRSRVAKTLARSMEMSSACSAPGTTQSRASCTATTPGPDAGAGPRAVSTVWLVTVVATVIGTAVSSAFRRLRLHALWRFVRRSRRPGARGSAYSREPVSSSGGASASR